jgi:uncharacterized membrane protein
MTDSLQDLATRMAESDRQERQWLNDEVSELEDIIFAIALQGEIKIPLRDLHARKNLTNSKIKIVEDELNRQLRISIETQEICPKCNGKGYTSENINE